MGSQGGSLTVGVMVTALLLSGAACEFGESEAGEKEASKRTVVQKAKITEEQAQAAAKEVVPGSVQSVRLESEDGNLVYEVTIQPQASGPATDVQVDANTGKVLKTEPAGKREADDDD